MSAYVLARTLAERVSRSVVLRRRLPARFGADRLVVSPGALLSLWRLDLEAVDPQLFAWADEFVAPGAVVWDIGANSGLFAFAAASRAGRSGRVVAVEPDLVLAGLLRRSARCASPERAPVEVLPVAVSDTVGLAELQIAARSRAANYLRGAGGSSQAGGARESQTVAAVTLDWLAERLPAPDLLKVDVEGAEAMVLAGGGRLLAEARPTLLCEVRASGAPQVTAMLRRHGYRLFDLGDPARPEIQTAAFNTLARP